MSHGEETLHRPKGNPIKDIDQCTRSNQMNGHFGRNAKELTLCISYRPQQHIVKIGLN